MTPPHDSSGYIVCLFIRTYQVEYAVLKAASEGRWEEVNQVFNRPGQQERVLHAQNKVICTEKPTSYSSSPLSVLCWLNTQCTLDVLWLLVFSVQCSLAGVPSTLLCTTATSTLSTSLWMCADFLWSRRPRYVQVVKDCLHVRCRLPYITNSWQLHWVKSWFARLTPIYSVSCTILKMTAHCLEIDVLPSNEQQ